MHFVTEEGTLTTKTGTLKTNQLQMRSVLLSVHGEVELLRWFCSGFDDKLPKNFFKRNTIQKNLISKRDAGWVEKCLVCDLKKI